MFGKKSRRESNRLKDELKDARLKCDFVAYSALGMDVIHGETIEAMASILEDVNRSLRNIEFELEKKELRWLSVQL